ncbi:unnamed protein product [Tetraodon nigroviridis]|uniref:(spotted green pufferfish) hypothetical protein n=1 Tax=Tetraodon nigroviridis TaxID=99883 RepID=Q4RHY2_TETNG|nr:unnamed protein product [Tetraodon nigroviridis]
MALFLDGTSQNDMDTSNFAHVIFQNVGKGYLPHAALECHYTLTQFIRPHPKDWVGIFKQEVQSSSQALQEEKAEVKRRLEEANARVVQLEEDLIGVTQKGLQKETELDSLKDRLKKFTVEKEALESQLKNEKDEKELYKIHLKNRELENTKLSAELQMLKSVDVNKENTIAQFKEEVGRLQSCLSEKDKQYREILAKVSPQCDIKVLKEQLRLKEEQLQANQQQLTLLAAELRDTSSTRDRTMSELYHMKLEADGLRQAKAEAQARCQSSRRRSCRPSCGGRAAERGGGPKAASAHGGRALQGEIQGVSATAKTSSSTLRTRGAEEIFSPGGSGHPCNPESRHISPGSDVLPGSPGSADPMLDVIIQEKLKGISREASDRNDKYRKCKQLLMEEKDRSCMYAEELTKLELKFKEQLKTNENLKLQLAAEEDRYKSQVAERGRELKELKDTLALVSKEKEKLQEELQKVNGGRKGDQEGSQKTSLESNQSSVPLFLQYPVPYVQDAPTPLLVAQSPSKLQFGNPYSISDPKDEEDEEFSDNQLLRLPPVGPPSWDSNVVCIQPTRNLSRPEGHEDSEEKQNNSDNPNKEPPATETRSVFVSEGQTAFCFDPSMDMKRCPLCEVIFPPNYDQNKFEEHVESHWKICPMCSEQFPPDCDQKVFENHVLTHFDGHPLSFD